MRRDRLPKVIARLLPPEDERQNARQRLAELRATSRIDDVISPVAEEWEADRVAACRLFGDE